MTIVAFGTSAPELAVSVQAALAMVTSNPARQLHIEDRVGSLEPGKDADLIVLGGCAGVEKAAEWFSIIVSIWIPLYLLISLRVMYRQNWFLTLGKYFVIGISYVMLLGFVTVGVAIASFVLL